MANTSEPMTVGGTYAMSLLGDWLECQKRARAVRENMLAHESDSPDSRKALREYVSALTTLWGELKPKIKGRKDEHIPESFTNEFINFEVYFHTPTLLLTSDNADDVFRLDAIIREALERLRITVYEW